MQTLFRTVSTVQDAIVCILSIRFDSIGVEWNGIVFNRFDVHCTVCSLPFVQISTIPQQWAHLLLLLLVYMKNVSKHMTYPWRWRRIHGGGFCARYFVVPSTKRRSNQRGDGKKHEIIYFVLTAIVMLVVCSLRTNIDVFNSLNFERFSLLVERIRVFLL